MQEFRADPVVEADAARHLLDVGSDLLAKFRDLVHESNLRGQERVGGIFDKFGRTPAGMQDRRGVEIKRPVELGHYFARADIVTTEDDSIRMLEILDRRALAQKFRIRHDGNIGVRPRLRDYALDLVAGADRHRRFGDHHRESCHRSRDFARRGVDVTQVRMTIATPRRRADRNEYRCRLPHRR